MGNLWEDIGDAENAQSAEIELERQKPKSFWWGESNSQGHTKRAIFFFNQSPFLFCYSLMMQIPREDVLLTRS